MTEWTAATTIFSGVKDLRGKHDMWGSALQGLEEFLSFTASRIRQSRCYCTMGTHTSCVTVPKCRLHHGHKPSLTQDTLYKNALMLYVEKVL